MAISVVQIGAHTNGATGTATTATLTIPLSSTGAGNTLICYAVYAQANSPTITATCATNTSVNVPSKYLLKNSGGLNATGNFFVLDNIASGLTSVVVTMTTTGTIFSLGWCYEVSGLLSTGSFDKDAGAQSTTGKPTSSGATATLTSSPELAIGGSLGFSTGAITGPVASATFTATNASPCVFTPSSGAGWGLNTAVTLSGASLPAGFSTGTTYYVVTAVGTTFELGATAGGSALGSTSTGSGTVTPVTAWTNEANQTCYTSSDVNAITSYQVTPNTNGIAYQVSPNTSNYYVTQVVTFQGGSSGPVIAVVPPVRPLFVSAAVSRASNW